MMSTLEDLLDNEIPTGRKALIDSHHNLPQVASYCEENYDKAINKRQALEETKNYVTQSLASVAYQINTLATSMLNMLDLQATQLSNMETNINHIAQTVSIHKEKVARREIGVLTTSKSCPRTHKIVAPSNSEKQQKYKSTPIDYTVLDDLGHGTRISHPQKKESRRSNSVSSTSTSGSADFPVFSGRNPNPPGPGHDTLGSRRRPMAAPPPAPMPPGNYSARHESQSSIHSNVQEPQRPPSLMGAPPPPSMTGMPVASTPPPPPSLTQDHPGPGVPMGAPPPPAPPPQPFVGSAPAPEDFPPPAPQPTPFTSQLSQVLNRRSGVEAQRPDSDMDLPPPPVDYDQGDFMGSPSLDDTMPPPPQFLQTDEPSWVPASYIEKVIAIFDYEATRDDELSFEEGALIYVLQKNPDGWYEGVMNGYTGLFPGNYVELCP